MRRLDPSSSSIDTGSTITDLSNLTGTDTTTVSELLDLTSQPAGERRAIVMSDGTEQEMVD